MTYLKELTYHDSRKNGFPGSSDDKAFAYNAREMGLIPGSGRSPGKGNGNSPQYSCLGTPWRRSLAGCSP